MFISNTRLKLAKNQAEAKQQPEAELLLIDIWLFTHVVLRDDVTNRNHYPLRQSL